jgi:phage shock protein A
MSSSSMWTRFLNIFRAKANKALDKAENVGETLDYSYARQRELLTQTRKGVVDVAASRKRVEIQVDKMKADANRLQGQAQKAIEAGREDLAREALTRKAALATQIATLETQRDDLYAQEEKLSAALRGLEAKVEAFRTRKETIKATYTAAEAQTRIAESVSGIGGEFESLGMAIERAENKTAEMQARGQAIDELVMSGALDTPALGGNDSIARELEAMSAESDVDAELARLKGALPAAKRLELES